MKISTTKKLEAIQNPSQTIAGVTNEALENIQQQITDVKGQVATAQSAVANLSTVITTKNVNASESVSGVTGSFDALSVSGTESVDTINAKTINADSGQITELNATKSTITNIEAASVNADSVAADSVQAGALNVDSLSIDAANIAAVEATSVNAGTGTIATLNSDSVNAGDITATGQATLQSVSAADVTAENLKVSTKVDSETVEATSVKSDNATINNIEAVSITLDDDTSSFITIDSDVFVKIAAGAGITDAKLKLKNSDGAVIASVDISVNLIATGKPSITISYTHNSALESIYTDADGNIWLQLQSGITGSLFYFTSGTQNVIPETYSQSNTPFDTSTATEYSVATNDTGILNIDSTAITIDAPSTNVKGNTTFDGNVYINGITTIKGFASERAKYLGDSDNVTADDDGIISAKGAAIDGDVSVTGDFAVDGTITGNVTGNLAGTADKATSDASGNSITATYATKANISNMMTIDTIQTVSARKTFSTSPRFSTLPGASQKSASGIVGFDSNGDLVNALVPTALSQCDAVVNTVSELRTAMNNSAITTIAVMNGTWESSFSSASFSANGKKVLIGFGTVTFSLLSNATGYMRGSSTSPIYIYNININMTVNNFFGFCHFIDCDITATVSLSYSTSYPKYYYGCRINTANNVLNCYACDVVVTPTSGVTVSGRHCRISISTNITSSSTPTIWLYGIYECEVTINDAGTYAACFYVNDCYASTISYSSSLAFSSYSSSTYRVQLAQNVNGCSITIEDSCTYADGASLSIGGNNVPPMVANNNISVAKSGTSLNGTSTVPCCVRIESQGDCINNTIYVRGDFVSSSVSGACIISAGTSTSSSNSSRIRGNYFLKESATIPWILATQSITNVIGNYFRALAGTANSSSNINRFFTGGGTSTVIANTAAGGFNVI